MKSVALDHSALSVRGAMHVVRTSSSLKAWRLPAWTWARSPDPAVDLMVGMTSGVRLCFTTDAEAFCLNVLETGIQLAGTPRRPATFDLYVDGIQERAAEAGSGHTILVDPKGPSFVPGTASEILFDALSPGLKAIELWLPQSAQVEVLSLSVSREAEILPSTEPTGLRWAHYGSSISHGMEAKGPSWTWPAVAARALGHELMNIGLAGQCHLDGFVARSLRDGPFDAISLEVGINIIGADTMRRRVFASALHSFLDTIREGKPDVPLLVISPIFCPLLETRTGPLTRDSLASYGSTERPHSAADGALTLVESRAILSDVITRRQNGGDANLAYLDGLTLFGAADEADLPDHLHPNAAGQERMGQRFAALGWASKCG
ncbi:MAG: GDSL-type esterase/lipase family protein [Hyphomonadaceae bacterium]